MNPAPDAEQRNDFFGVTGTQALYGGGRGRVFEVNGYLIGDSRDAVVAAKRALLSYADGVARDFFDGDDTWPMVKFNGEFRPSPGGIVPCIPYGYAQAYSLILRGLR